MKLTRKLQPASLLLAVLAAPAPLVLATPVAAQQLDPVDSAPLSADDQIIVSGSVPADISGLPEGPDIEGFISARSNNAMQVTQVDGSGAPVLLSSATEVKASGGFLGLNRDRLGSDALLNGLPVTIKTVQWGDGLVATRIKVKNKDLKTAAMIRNGTDQRFGEQGAAIGKNAAATEALRGRMGDIDKYNIRTTTNVYFDTGKWNLSAQARDELCETAAQAGATENALMLVVGYTDSVGSQEVNQRLSEKRAGGVVNYLQQACGWKPYRMLTPTGMAEADPMASNDTAQGKAQNRRVSVNVLVSKSLDGA